MAEGKNTGMEARLPLSRRTLLASGGAAAAALAASATAAGATPAGAAQAPAASSAGRRFNGYVIDGASVGVRQLTLLPLQPRAVLIRTEAAALCYTMVGEGLRGVTTPNPGALDSGNLFIGGHSAVGVVEEVGSLVQRVKVGDRVIVGSVPQCGQCYHCLHGAAEFCAMLHQDAAPIATLDGRNVTARGGIGGLAELCVVGEELCVPVTTGAAPAQLALLADTASVGLAAAFNQLRIEPGTDVVVQGCGPVGLAAVQGARIKGAAQIIAIEPIASRRALALELGATAALDPAAEGDGLVAKVRDMCKGPTDRALGGGRAWAADKNFPNGPDYTIEAAGNDRYPPQNGPSPDPTGVLPLQQAWEYTRSGGHLICLSVGQTGSLDLAIPTWQFFNRGRTIHSGQMGGLQPMRDLPRMVRLIESGLFDAESMLSRTYSLDDTNQAFRDVAARSVVGAVVTF